MLPVLFNAPALTIYTFGAFLVLCLLWGSFLLWKNIKLTAYKEEDFFDGLFVSLIGAIFFGRLTFFLLNYSEFGADLLKFILINGYPGLSLFGTVLGGLLTFFIYTRFRKRPFLEMIDYAVSPLFLSLGIGSLGAFLSGTTPGTKTNFMFSFKYLGLEGSRHIPAVYEALLYLVGCYLSYLIVLYIRRSRFRQGTAFFFFLFYFSIINLVLDNLKANSLYLGSFRFNIVIGTIVTLIASLYFIIVSRQRIKKLIKIPRIKRNGQ